jgi:phosphoglycolate phosphatase
MALDLSGATIVFDLDGTLVDTAPDLAAATNHALSLVGLEPITVAGLHPFIGHGSRVMIDAGLRMRGVEMSDDEVTRLHEAFFAYYADHVADFSQPFEGVVEVLDRLRQAGARLAVCTNKLEKFSKQLLATLKLDWRFGTVAGRDTFKMCKPAPGHLTLTIEGVGGRVERAVMIGDSEVDIATAKAAGVPVIGVTFGYTPRPVHELGPDAIIDHYRDFMPALEAVLPRG